MDYVQYIASIITEDPNLLYENAQANPNQNVTAITNAINGLTTAVKTAMADQNMDQQSKNAIGELNNKVMPLIAKVNAALQNAAKATTQPTQPAAGAQTNQQPAQGGAQQPQTQTAGQQQAQSGQQATR